MKTLSFDARRLDVAAFAAAAGRLEGRVPVVELRRLAEGLEDPCRAVGPEGSGAEVESEAPDPDVTWQVGGAVQPAATGKPRLGLHVRAQARVLLKCPRCLRPLAIALRVDRFVRFVTSEAEAARLDAEGEEDVLAASHALDLLDLVEDELILEMPVAPRHESCEPPWPAALAQRGGETAAPCERGDGGSQADTGVRHRPFAGLGVLRGGKPDGPGRC